MRWTHLLLCLLVVLVLGLVGCDSIRVTYGEATYTRTTLLMDKQVEGVSLMRQGDDVVVEVGKADSEARLEALRVALEALELAR